MALLHKAFDTVQTPIKAEAPDLAAIRKFALREVSEADVWTGSMKLCHDRYDRTHERFPKAYLERFAETLPGKAVMGGHDYSTLPLGRFYAAEVVPDSEGHHLRVRYYLPKDSPLVPQIELGVLKDVSVGFQAGRRVCDLCNDTWLAKGCDHFPGQEVDGKTVTLTYCESEAHKAEAMEGSFVWLGAQPGAEAVALAAKTHMTGLTEEQRRFWMMGTPWLTPPPDAQAKEKRMEIKTLEDAHAEIKRLQALPLAADREKELTDQIKALETKTAELEAKAPLAADGAAYRAYLKGEIGRVAGVLGRAATYATVLEHLKDATAEQLQPVLDELVKEFDEKFSAGTARTGGPKDEDDKTETKRSGLLGRLASGGYW